MKYRKRTYYTEADKALMWDRWQQGESLHEIARLFDRYHHSVRRILAATVGIPYLLGHFTIRVLCLSGVSL